MDGICTHCGLAYSPDDAECRQCGEEVGGRERRGFLSRLFGRRKEAEARAAPARPEVVSTRTQRIEIVGPDGERRVYGSLDEVPAAERERLEQAQDLSEDLMESLGRLGGTVTHHTISTSGSSVSVTVDGDAQVYASLDQVPEEFRDKIRDALEMVEDLLPDDDPPDA